MVSRSTPARRQEQEQEQHCRMDAWLQQLHACVLPRSSADGQRARRPRAPPPVLNAAAVEGGFNRWVGTLRETQGSLAPAVTRSLSTWAQRSQVPGWGGGERGGRERVTRGREEGGREDRREREEEGNRGRNTHRRAAKEV